MNRLFFSIGLLIIALGSGCSPNSEFEVPVEVFQQQLSERVDAHLLDVRTPEEFATGHLPGAINVDWNASNFEAEVDRLDRSKKVFVYCLSGPRSAAAGARLRSMGFQEVVELKGGMMAWRKARLPEEGSGADGGTDASAFARITSSEIPVLVDFYAEWCAPCKKMKPDLEQLEQQANGAYRVVRIDADASRALCAELGIDALPELRIYHLGDEIWNHRGYLDRAGMEQALQSALRGQL